MIVHQVEPSSAYTFSFGPVPARFIALMSRLMPTSAVAGVYGPSRRPTRSKPEW